MKHMMRICAALMAIVAIVLLVAAPALAMSNPDAIEFYCAGSTPTYKAFYNVVEADDMLFVAEQYVHYTVSQNYTASEAFLFEVIGVGGTTIAATPLNEYDAQPISIYLTAAQVSSANITVGDALSIRITGNPLIFPTTTNNTVTAALAASDYVDQYLGADGGVATDNMLRNFLINKIAPHLETADNATYVINVKGIRYLNSTGASIFLEGIPGLDAMCPILFQYSVAPMTGDEPESTGAYTSTLSPLAKWGETAANGLTNLGVYLGVNQSMAGSAVLFALVVALAFYVYQRTQSGIAVLLLIATTPFIGSWFGLMPIALAFIFAIAIVVLLGYFFFSRGAL